MSLPFRASVLTMSFVGAFIYYGVAKASATGVYVAQSAAGAADGSSCTNARAYTFFNSASNWGSSPTQIGPGTTVHVCGAFSVSSNSTVFTFHGSGSNGNPVRLFFETGAYLRAPYFNLNGAIYSNGNGYITIDGGSACGANGVTCNGYIQNTLNGTSGGACPGGTCTNQQSSTGINLVTCTGCVVQNMGVYDIYDRSSSGDAAPTSICIQVKNNSTSGATNTQVLNSTMHDCGAGFYGAYGTGDSGWAINGNKVYHTNWGIAVNGQSTGNTLSSSAFNSNEIFDAVNWNDGPLDTPKGPYNNHHNYIVLFSGNTGTSITNTVVCNNYGHGDFGSGTAVFDVQNSAATADSVTFCNNFINLSATTNTTGGDGGIYAENDNASGSVAFDVYNNTIVGVNTMAGIAAALTGIATVAKNNIVQNWGTPFWLFDGAPLPKTMNYNDWYQPTAVGANGEWDNNGAGYRTLNAWQRASGLDMNSTFQNPLLASNGTPQSGSVAMTMGAANNNLTDLCTGNLAVLCLDRAGTQRPSSGSWVVGAYNGGTVAPPTTLAAMTQ